MFGPRLRQAREARKLSQSTLGARIGATQDDVHRWEAGKTTPRLDRLIKVARALRVSVDWLAGLRESGGPRRK